MLALETIRDMLQDRNLREVSRQSKVHYNVIYRLANGTKNPAYATVRKLSDYLERKL